MTQPAPPDPARPPVAREPQRVVVTGADSGIGRASAVALAAPGRHVGLTWNRDREGAERTAETVRAAGATPAVRHLDLTDPPAGGRVVDDLAAAMGGLGTLVMSSGTGCVTGASWPVDGGMLAMSPMAGSHLQSHDGRRP